MIRTALLAAVTLASTALATGERITVTGAAAPLKDMLCVSMNCVNGGGARDFVVSGKPVKGGVEIAVVTSTGQARLTHVAPLNSFGQISSTDLVHASTLVVQSIEKGPIAAPAAPKAKLSKLQKNRKMLRAAVAKR
ncbi:MAG: hypothetical protein QM817_37025 [Archangium sp.]